MAAEPLAAEPVIAAAPEASEEPLAPLRLWWLAIFVLSLAGWAVALFLTRLAAALLS